MTNLFSKKCAFGFSAMALMFAASNGVQAANLVTNGGFESTTNGNGQLGNSTNATGWNISGGYTFLFSPGSADTTGANGQYGNLQLWGPGNGSANGLPSTSPVGGNYIAQDPAFQPAPITQEISGLTIGNQYSVGFWWGGAQQLNFTGDTYEGWQVSLGSETHITTGDINSGHTVGSDYHQPGTISNANHGFTGWSYESLQFTATATKETLSFLANGGPNGVPPFAVLDGVSVNAVPEPSSLALSFLGLLGLGALKYRRRAAATTAV